MKKEREPKHPITDNFLSQGRIPPQAIDFEEAVIGALILEQDAYVKISKVLKPEVFYKDASQRIVKAIISLAKKYSPIDMLTVCEELKKTGELELVGGPFFIATISNKIASATNIESHYQTIQEKYFLREIIQVSSELQCNAYDDSIDVFDLLEKLNKKYIDLMKIVKFSDNSKHLSVAITQSMQELEKRMYNFQNGILNGVPSGLQAFDYITNGWQKGELIVLAARPGMGKTAVSLKFAKEAAKAGFKVRYYSLEMSNIKLADRLILSECNIDAFRFKKGDVYDYELQEIHARLGMLLDLGIYIDDNPSPTIDYITADCTIAKEKGECDIVFIDYFQLVDMKSEKVNRNREQEVSENSRKTKVMAKSLDVPVILLSQLSRAVEIRGGNKIPILSDLRESGAIEQDADMVIFLYRPEYYDIKEDANGNSTVGFGQLIIAKFREGARKPVDFGYDVSMAKIYDYNPFQVEETKIKPNKDFSEPNKEDYDYSAIETEDKPF
jgi:replicative DNA helicase